MELKGEHRGANAWGEEQVSERARGAGQGTPEGGEAQASDREVEAGEEVEVSPRLSQDEQDEIVQRIDMACHEQSDEDYDELCEKYYDQLDIEHQAQVDDNVREFADGAVGTSHWDSDA